MKSIIVVVLFSMFLFQTVLAQDSTKVAPSPKSKKNIAEKIYFGGNIGLSFGSYTMVGIYPIVGYKLTPKLSTGVKATYQYISDSRYTPTYTSSNYGGSVFARYRIIPILYAHIEYESINYDLYYSSSRVWVPFLYVGGGLSKTMGGNVWLNIQVLFDVLQDSQSPYSQWDPFFSMGVGVGF